MLLRRFHFVNDTTVGPAIADPAFLLELEGGDAVVVDPVGTAGAVS